MGEFEFKRNSEGLHLQLVTQSLSSPISAIHHVRKIINLIPPQEQLVADGIHRCLVPLSDTFICYVLVLKRLTFVLTCYNLKLKPVVTLVQTPLFCPKVVTNTLTISCNV